MKEYEILLKNGRLLKVKGSIVFFDSESKLRIAQSEEDITYLNSEEVVFIRAV